MLSDESAVLSRTQNHPLQMSDFRKSLWHILLVVLGVVIFIIGIYLLSSPSIDQQVTLNVLNTDDGTRTRVEYSLTTGVLTNGGASDDVRKEIMLSDGSVIEVASTGIIKKSSPSSTEFELLVASPVVASATTPLAVWRDGARLAWVSPADNSIQVYEKSPRGAYVPLLVQSKFFPNSIQFSNDGSKLIVAKLKSGSTDVYSLMLHTGDLKMLTTLNGLATLVNNQ